MKLLLLVISVLGLTWAQVTEPTGDMCQVFRHTTQFDNTEGVVITLTDNATGLVVTEIHNDMVVKAHLTLPPTATEVYCLMHMGLASNWQRISPCLSERAVDGSATCTFNMTGVQPQGSERVGIKFGIIDGMNFFRTQIEGLSFRPNGRKVVTEFTTTTTARKSTTTPAPVVEIEDPHDAKMEAFLAAKWAEQQQQMAEDEDKNSEGDWQRLEMEEKRQHDLEVQKEMEDFEARQAEEHKRREEMIRAEMEDKERNEQIEKEYLAKTTTTTAPRFENHEDETNHIDNHENIDGVVEVKENNIVVDSGASYVSIVPIMVLIATLMAAILI